MIYSKSKVDRAGKTLADRLRLIIAGRSSLGQQPSEVLEAIEIIEWWRREHAKPLSRVAANLRYYAGDQGKPVVAQRLKKFPTIAGKLLREPGMNLSRMAGIGGVRAVCPIKMPPTESQAGCERTGLSPGSAITWPSPKPMAIGHATSLIAIKVD